MNTRKILVVCLAALMVLTMVACGGEPADQTTSTQTPSTTAPSVSTPATEESTTPSTAVNVADKNDLTVVRSMELKYANNFSVDYCANGCKIIVDGSERTFLWVPEGNEIPDDTGDMIVLQAPLTKLGCFSTTHAALFNAIGAVDKITLVTSAQEKWQIAQVAQQMEEGTTIYVGKNSAPDFELISQAAPQVIIITANTMHGSTEVLEKLDELGIFYVADSQHLETHPLGRVEWVKLIGALLDMEEEADAYFDNACNRVEEVAASVMGQTTHPSIIQTYVYNNLFYVRNGASYVNKMLTMAGGTYPFADLNPEDSGNTKMSVEEFYASTLDTDILIYDNIDDPNVSCIADILEYGDYLADMKAIKEGNVWGLKKNYFQAYDDVATMIEDIATIIYYPENEAQLHYFYRLPATSEGN